MKKYSASLLGAVLMVACGMWALAAQQKPVSADVLLGQALHQEQNEGRIEDAIASYKKVLTAADATRAQKARAQFRIGACYERLGADEARKAYEAVVANYGDQADFAAQAKARLAALAAPTGRAGSGAEKGLTVRKLYDEGAVGALSPDGSHLTLLTGSEGLAVRELATGKVRELLTKSDKSSYAFAHLSVFSPDSRKIAYSWYDENEVFGVWLVNLDGSGNRPLVRGEKEWHTEPTGWFPDGEHILAVRYRSLYLPPAACQIVSVAVSDGSFKVVKELGTQTPALTSLSPDGRFIVYDYPPAESTNHDIYLMAADGSNATRLVESPANDYVLGWAPGGTRVMFASDRAGDWGAWIVAVENGKAQGAPTLVKQNIGRISAVGFARDGAFYFGIGGWLFDIYAQDIDLAQGKILSEPTLAVQRFVGSNMSLSWSRDGQYLTYISRRSPGAARAASEVLRIRTVASGAERELAPELDSMYTPRWSPDGRHLLIQGFDRSNRLGDFLLDVLTGALRPVLQTGKDNYTEALTAEWSSDGTSVFYVRSNPTEPKSQIMARNLATAEDSPIASSPRKDSTFVDAPKAAPDGTRIAALMWDENSKARLLTVFPSRGGEVRTFALDESSSIGVTSVQPSGQIARGIVWTPDSRQLLFIKELPQGRTELWLVSAENGSLRKVGDFPAGAGRLALHPDGRKFAYTTSVHKDEVWVMENFLPAPKGGK